MLKKIYKKIDLSKITNNNFNSLFDQYKKHCIQQSINDINNTLIPQNQTVENITQPQTNITTPPQNITNITKSHNLW